MTTHAYRHLSSAAFAVLAAGIALKPTLGELTMWVVGLAALAALVLPPLVNQEIRQTYASAGLKAGDGLLLPAAVILAAIFISGSDPGFWNVALGALTLAVGYFMGTSFWRQALAKAESARQDEARGQDDGGPAGPTP
ncbi:hypothetical protein [Zhihengliuella flava]|uniref:Uncharacterized protein n=1 Tax=Zhihengliuella flava TaxID=1285193 RepID=A0A931GJ52_9MICC|nr:hypothetical protein [Zhihengliuella flava]MBG6084966.1 hypothetical protein [Zhihengliuella flava]